jgi:dihydroxy-acid dehydratase
MIEQLNEGMTLKPAVKYQKIVQTFGTPRDNH